jgi:nicotinate-nucleotide pyrophosphorylase (carboxylating)
MTSPLSPSGINYLADLEHTVRSALAEDIGSGDITASLVDPEEIAEARIICRESAIVCGKPWVDETLKQVDPQITATWLVEDGQPCGVDDVVVTLQGPARSILTAERTLLNFLQALSGTATLSHHYATLVAHTNTRVLDTRKTLPGLRLAQKYAVVIGGGLNHRIGLYDAFLIKENHIMAAGSITKAIQKARSLKPGYPVEVEIESLDQLEEALSNAPDVIMLDNFSNDDIVEAVKQKTDDVKLEASGNYHLENIAEVAETGVDFISVGALTKHCRAIDFSLRLV